MNAARPSPLSGLAVGAAIWAPLLALIFAPLMSFLIYGFFQVEDNQIQRTLSLETYREALTNPAYMRTFGKTVLLALQVSLACLVLGYATAYFVWRRPARWRAPLLFLLAAPLLMSYVIRIYAMRGVLGANGLLNGVLTTLGIVDEPVTAFLFNLTAVKLTLIVILLPFATLPTFIALERIPASLLQASSDLGAGAGRTFRSVVLPLSLPGATVGAMFTFVLAMGDFLAPELVGGIDGFTYGRLVFTQFGLAFNWPLGAALSALLLAVALCVVFGARAIGSARWRR
ncbi:MAG: ABC transporter permease [Alphaproteobacteria bacterium]|nr:ABC transporter permease [Alphaproteobacteria bacterium]